MTQQGQRTDVPIERLARKAQYEQTRDQIKAGYQTSLEVIRRLVDDGTFESYDAAHIDAIRTKLRNGYVGSLVELSLQFADVVLSEE